MQYFGRIFEVQFISKLINKSVRFSCSTVQNVHKYCFDFYKVFMKLL